MTAIIALPQARIPLGWATVQGQRVPVEIDPEWMITLLRLVERTGGVSGSSNFTQYINQFFDAPTDLAAQEAARGVEELRHALESARGEVQSLRMRIDDLESQLAGVRPAVELRNRIEQIEDRLQ